MTQTATILAHLRTAPLTPIEALREYGCFRLAARIQELEDAGHQIASERVTQNGKTFARYRLVKERDAA